jgi:hypothetical protein
LQGYVLLVPAGQARIVGECTGDYAQTEVATHYFWIADNTSM